MRSGSSYLSQSELVLTFGLGNQSKADKVEVEWPSGQHDTLSNVSADQMITVQEAGGIKANLKLKPRS
jgi:enediyne biosynthesis protein E4